MFCTVERRGRMSFLSILPRLFRLPALRARVLFLAFLVVLLALSSAFHVRNLYYTDRNAEKRSSLSCDGRWIYIYDLDHMFNQRFVGNCTDVKKNVNLCPYMENHGMGRGFPFEEEVFGDGVWFNTWQFSLEMYFHARLLRYPCIAATEKAANAFYVPFYVGMDLSYQMTHISLKALRKNREANYRELLNWLRGQYSFLRHSGLDHFMTLGRIALDFRRPKNDVWGTQMLEEPDFKNMVKFTLERDGSTPVYSNNEIAIPYPSYFHPSNSAQVAALMKWSHRDSQRSVFVSIAGTRRRQGQGGITEKLMDDCEKSSRCTVLVCVGNEGVHQNQTDLTARSYSFLPIAGHTLTESCSFPSIVLDVFHKSVFCLQPPGDSPTRRSFIDSLIAGCIPVIFKPNSAWSQYPAFLPEKGDVYSVLISIDEVRKRNVVQILAEIPRRRIHSMRAKIKQLLPRILYSNVERKYVPDGESGEEVLDGTDDAFHIALNEVFSLMRKNLDQG